MGTRKKLVTGPDHYTKHKWTTIRKKPDFQSVIWTLLILITYPEGIIFEARTDCGALRWLLEMTD